MKQRCNNPKHPAAPWYHHKNIRVCKQWSEDFFAFQSWALQSGYSKELTIDRIDSDGNYCPENCRWITLKENCSRARHTKSIRKHTKKTKGKYEVWHTIINLCAIVYKSGLMYSEANQIVKESIEEHKLPPGECFSVVKPTLLHKEGDIIILKK